MGRSFYWGLCARPGRVAGAAPAHRGARREVVAAGPVRAWGGGGTSGRGGARRGATFIQRTDRSGRRIRRPGPCRGGPRAAGVARGGPDTYPLAQHARTGSTGYSPEV